MILGWTAMASAQVGNGIPHVDTLTIAERISVRTNAVGWTLLTPNIGAEFQLRPETWSRWTVGLNLRWRPKGSNTFVHGFTYDTYGIRAEVRNYWRPREMSDPVNALLPKHHNFIDKLMSLRTDVRHHPKTVYYRGFYADYNHFTFMPDNDGRQGKMISAGVLWGFQRPMYVYANGNSIDLDIGIAAGVGVTQYDKFKHSRTANKYYVTEHKDWQVVKHPVVSDVHVGFVYRFGHHPLPERYQWRYEVDLAYQAAVDSLNRLRQRQKIEKAFNDSLTNAMFDYFEATYDSILLAKQTEKDSLNFLKVSGLGAKLQHKAEEAFLAKQTLRKHKYQLRHMKWRLKVRKRHYHHAEHREELHQIAALKAAQRRQKKAEEQRRKLAEMSAKRIETENRLRAAEEARANKKKAQEERYRQRIAEKSLHYEQEKAKADSALRVVDEEIRKVKLENERVKVQQKRIKKIRENRQIR